MHLSSLTLTNLRQFDHRTFEFQPGFNLLVGENGAGKTTILRGLLGALAGTQQQRRHPKLEDDDIRLGTRQAEVRAEVYSSNGHIEAFHFRKTLWERAERSRRVGVPLVLLYTSNEAACSAMRVKRAKPILDLESDNLRRSEDFLYEAEREFSRGPTDPGERRFGNSESGRNFVGRVLSTFAPDFRHFYWRFEPYDCSLVPAAGSADKVKTQKRARDFAMRYFQEDLPGGREKQFDWPDQAKVVLTSKAEERTRGEKYLPDLPEIWKGMRISSEDRDFLLSCSLEVKLTPRIMIQRRIGPLRLSQLSDGEQRLFSLFVDIARQLSLQNPQGEIGGGEAIVLIDEIDAHLHPKWQRKIVPALEDLFQGCQFIATTHSPFVIQAVAAHKLQHIDRELMGDIRDRGIEEIAVKVMGIEDPSQRAISRDVRYSERVFPLARECQYRES
jgi:predicted ATPase